MITVGLDFGTHQTKVCVEKKEGVELSYTFMTFEDSYYKEFYTLPSVIGIDKDDLLHYGFLNKNFEGKIIKYFKQSTFDADAGPMPQETAWYYSIWYIAYLIFDLEKKYDRQFAIQMGAPTDSSHVGEAKQIATRIVASAYRLVEDVFVNDKQKFLSTPMKELVEITEIVPYSQEIKEDYDLLVFPEAYACLMPLISQGKLETGMNLMIDIGGGTTDISFFTIEKNKPQVYAFYSLDMGLNYLTHADDNDADRIDPNVKDAKTIDLECLEVLSTRIRKVCYMIRQELVKELTDQTPLGPKTLHRALNGRPLIYCGGGSTFEMLRHPYDSYLDLRLISHREWKDEAVVDIEYIIKDNLCPILSTAYGLAISTENDDIEMKPLKDIYENIRGKGFEDNTIYNGANDRFDYGLDDNAWK